MPAPDKGLCTCLVIGSTRNENHAAGVSRSLIKGIPPSLCPTHITYPRCTLYRDWKCRTKMSELAQLFASCEAAVPQFEVIKRKPAPVEEASAVSDATNDKAEDSDVKNQPRSRPTKPRPRGRRGARDPRDSRTVFVGNIPCTCTKKQILRLFKTCGKVESVRLRNLQIKEGKLPKKVAIRTHKQLTEESTFNAYVVFSSEEEAEKSLKLNSTLLSGHHLRVDPVTKKESAKLEETHLSVFVGNLPFTADEEKLRGCFSNCGDVESVRIIRDSKTGIGKGFGFVTFLDKSGVMFAVKQSRKIELDGRKLRVFKSKDEQTLKLQKQAKFSGLRTDLQPKGKVTCMKKGRSQSAKTIIKPNSLLKRKSRTGRRDKKSSIV